MELAEEYPKSVTAQVTLPSELATQVYEILSSSSVAELTSENLPGSRKVDVILPSEVATQVYEILAHSSLAEMKPEDKPSSLTASVAVVEKVSVQVIYNIKLVLSFSLLTIVIFKGNYSRI